MSPVPSLRLHPGLFLAVLGMILVWALAAPAGAATIDPARTGGADLKPLVTAQERAAGEAMQTIEDEVQRWNLLPPDERARHEKRLGSDLEHVIEISKGTKYENKALYWLASWRLAFAGGRGVSALLDRLEGCAYPSFKDAGAYLRVQVLLKQGHVSQAHRMATALTAKVPEFAPLLDLVGFYQRIGAKAPMTAGRNLVGGGAKDPAAGPTPWLLYVFVPDLTGDALTAVDGFAKELSAPLYAGRVRMVCVVFAGSPLASVTAASSWGSSVDALWADPNKGGDAARWQAAWHFPPLPTNVLIGPDRTITAVEVTIDDLHRLIAAQPPAPGTTATTVVGAPPSSVAPVPSRRRAGWAGRL